MAHLSIYGILCNYISPYFTLNFWETGRQSINFRRRPADGRFQLINYSSKLTLTNGRFFRQYSNCSTPTRARLWQKRALACCASHQKWLTWEKSTGIVMGPNPSCQEIPVCAKMSTQGKIKTRPTFWKFWSLIRDLVGYTKEWTPAVSIIRRLRLDTVHAPSSDFSITLCPLYSLGSLTLIHLPLPVRKFRCKNPPFYNPRRLIQEKILVKPPCITPPLYNHFCTRPRKKVKYSILTSSESKFSHFNIACAPSQSGRSLRAQAHNHIVIEQSIGNKNFGLNSFL